MGTIFNIQRYCLHDGDGIRTTVFFKGCPLRCIWCHNPEGLEKGSSLSFNEQKCSVCGKCLEKCPFRAINEGILDIPRDKCIKCGECVVLCPNGANEIIGKDMTASEVIDTVRRDIKFYRTSGGGMTLSGGEPSMQADFALELISLAKNEGISAFVETCGFGERRFYSEALSLGATFLFDIKAIDNVRHKELTGVSNEKIIANLEFLLENGGDVIIRLPMIPDVNDKDEDIKKLCDYLKKIENKVRYIEVMPYHALGTGKAKKLGTEDYYNAPNASGADKARWKELFASFGVSARIPD